jgi:hypothetical protein
MPPQTGYIFIVTVVFWIYAIARRYQMRKKFGMPRKHTPSAHTLLLPCMRCLHGAHDEFVPTWLRLADGTWKIVAHDVYAWMCCTLCALCQEARTLSYNNVIDGRWLGPAVSLNGLDLASEMEKAQALQAEAAMSAEGSSARIAGLGGGGSQYGLAAAGDPADDGLLPTDDDE